MKINWEDTKRKTALYAWPSMLAFVATILVAPVAAENLASWGWALPFLLLLIFLPFLLADVRYYREQAALEKRELRAKYDAQDQAMFGKPLRDIEI